MRRDILRNYAASSDDRVVPNRDAFEDETARPDPDSVFDRDRVGFKRTIRQRMLIGIHDHHVPRYLAIATYRDGFGDDDLCISIQVCAVADMERGTRPAFDAYTWKEGTVFNLDTAAVFDTREREPPAYDDDTRLLKVSTQPHSAQVFADAGLPQALLSATERGVARLHCGLELARS
jgi:hypothetical protein